MYALTNAPAHLIVPVKQFGIGVYADPDVASLPNKPLPPALVCGPLTRFSDGKQIDAFLRLVSMLRELGYTVVTISDE
jgi:hypothetical protein